MTRRKPTVEPVFHRLTVEDLERVDAGELSPDDLLAVPRPDKQRLLFDDAATAIVERMRRAREAEREAST